MIMRKAISNTFRLYIGFLKLCRLLTYEIQGLEKLQKQGQLILVNHPTLLDVVFVMSLIDRADCVVKSNLWKSALTRGPVNAADYISNGSEQLIMDCVNSLKAGNTLIIFPEGTRTIPGTPIKFHRGASNIALMAEKNITPILIDCKPLTLRKTDKWYHIPERAPHFCIKVLDDVSIEDILHSDHLQSKKARQLNSRLQTFFMSRLTEHFGIEFPALTKTPSKT